MSESPVKLPSRGTRNAWFVASVVALCAVILAVHGRSLTYGLFMDDWAH